MDESSMVELLRLVLTGEADYQEVGIERVCDYSEAGLMTDNVGLVVTLGSGAEFQLRVVQSA